MKTKEEIFKKHESQQYVKSLLTKSFCLNAMQEYADEQSIAFAEWKDKINFHDNENCYDIKSAVTLTDDLWTIKHTAKLLQIFKNEIK
jgi:hypothetical protein